MIRIPILGWRFWLRDASSAASCLAKHRTAGERARVHAMARRLREECGLPDDPRLV